MTVRVEQSELFGWRGYSLSAGETSVGVVPDIGGRILSLTHRGEELLFVQPEHRGQIPDLDRARDLRELKRELGFRLWGGDKTWVSPQSAWWEGIPPLDLDVGRYDACWERGSLVMTSARCRETGLRLIRRVELHQDGEIRLDQELRNEGDGPARRGIWDVTQCLRPFDVYLPTADVRPYPEEGDSVRLHGSLISPNGGWIRIPCREPLHFKFGGLAERGVVVALRTAEEETLAFVRYFETDPSAAYAHDASVEVYNSPDYDYFEIEVHAALKPLPPGGSVKHRQRWRVGRLKGPTDPDTAAAAATLGGRERRER